MCIMYKIRDRFPGKKKRRRNVLNKVENFEIAGSSGDFKDALVVESVIIPEDIPMAETIDKVTMPCKCRLCLVKITSHATPIWGVSGIYEKVIRCSAVTVLETDMFQFVCSSCKQHLDYVNKFQQMCLKSNEIFLNLAFVKTEDCFSDSFNQVEIPIEPLNEDDNISEESRFHGVKEEIFDTFANFEIEVAERPSEDEKHTEENHCLGENEDFDTATNLEIEDEMEREYPCCKCPMISFQEKDYLIHRKSHRVRHHKIGKFQNLCPFCGKTISENRFSAHMRSHTQQPVECGECGKKLSGKTHLKEHQLRHQPLVLFECELCGNKYNFKHSLKKHLDNVHKQKPKCSCPYCDRKFSCQYNMRVHLRTHTGEVPYSCPDCGISFAHRVTMKLHRLKEHKVNMFDPSPQKDRIRGKKTNKKGDVVPPSQDANLFL